MKKIAVVFDGMGYGGIERIGIDYIKIFIELGYKVDVYNLNPKANALVSTLPKEVCYKPHKFSREMCPETYSYGIQKWWWGKYAYAIISPILSIGQFFIKAFIRKKEMYDIAIAISGHINDLSFTTKNFIKSQKKICWCHGNIISYLAICDAYAILYKKIDAIVTLSSVAEKNIYPGRKYLYDKKIVKIYNPTYITKKKLDQEKIANLKKEYGDFMLMIARADFNKAYDIAIRTVRKLKENGIDRKILFAGDGELLDDYKEFARREGIANNCIFLGNCEDIQNYIKASYINILTSRWEGLPTVIIEAMALGKPCVMTNTDDGEVSQNGRFCILKDIEDYNGLADGLARLYTDSEEYKKYEKLSLQRAEDFSIETIKKKIVSLLESL